MKRVKQGREEAGIPLDGHHPRAVKEKEREGGMSKLGGSVARFGYLQYCDLGLSHL